MLILAIPIVNCQELGVKKSREITQLITEVQLQDIRSVIEPYFDGPLDSLELGGAYEVGERRLVSLSLKVRQSQPGPADTFYVRVDSQRYGPWVLAQLTKHREHQIPGVSKPVAVVGEISPESLLALIDHVRQFWAKAGAGELAINGVATNLLPPLRKTLPYLDGKNAREVYSVAVTSLEPPPLPNTDGNALILGSSVGSAFNVRLESMPDGSLAVLEVHPSGYPANDPHKLALLNRYVDRPLSQEEHLARTSAARAVLPDALKDIELTLAWLMLDGQWESIHYQIQTAHTPGELVDRFVYCGRIAGTDDSWQCQYTDRSQKY